MRRFSICAVVGGTLLVVAGASAAIRPLSLVGAHRRADSRRASRMGVETDDLPSVGECGTTRGARMYGSAERCRRALCAGRNVINAFVTDGAHRLRRNPCAGVDPFERP